MDGLCGGVVAITSCGFLAVVGLLAQQDAISPDGGALIVMLSVAMLGACLAFLVSNFNPASMFMGDSGSLLLGFSVAGAIMNIEGGGVTMVLGLGFCAAGVVGVANATNLIDGMDGLCGGVVAITSCGFLAVVGLLAQQDAISPDDRQESTRGRRSADLS